MKAGFTRTDDILPARLYGRRNFEGLSKGQMISLDELNKMLDEYYEARGWNKEGGA